MPEATHTNHYGFVIKMVVGFKLESLLINACLKSPKEN